MKPFAVFVVVTTSNGLFAATTRVEGGIGLPGGKVDFGEKPEFAVIREAAEEGFAIKGPLFKIHSALVSGKMVFWYTTPFAATILSDFKEKGRIFPIETTLDKLAASGFGNNFLTKFIPCNTI